jgi:hypothetical protein
LFFHELTPVNKERKDFHIRWLKQRNITDRINPGCWSSNDGAILWWMLGFDVDKHDYQLLTTLAATTRATMTETLASNTAVTLKVSKKIKQLVKKPLR